MDTGLPSKMKLIREIGFLKRFKLTKPDEFPPPPPRAAWEQIHEDWNKSVTPPFYELSDRSSFENYESFLVVGIVRENSLQFSVIYLPASATGFVLMAMFHSI